MAHPNAVLLRRTYEAVGSGDLQPLLDVLADDVAWSDSSLGPLAGEYHGRDDVVAFFGKMMEVYAGTLRVEVQDILANDAHGVVLTRENGEAAGQLDGDPYLDAPRRPLHRVPCDERRCV